MQSKERAKSLCVWLCVVAAVCGWVPCGCARACVCEVCVGGNAPSAHSSNERAVHIHPDFAVGGQLLHLLQLPPALRRVPVDPWHATAAVALAGRQPAGRLLPQRLKRRHRRLVQSRHRVRRYEAAQRSESAAAARPAHTCPACSTSAVTSAQPGPPG